MTAAVDVATPPRAVPLSVYYVVFTLSGFAGLIYESIWSHYLKLLLGHAAYAQTVVLGIFMGGLALGSWWAARAGARWSRLLLGYAAVEALIGLAALGFHPLFVAVNAAYMDFAATSGFGPRALDVVKWSLGALMIAPQSCLLGMTFPLLTAGLLRGAGVAPGRALATLYCLNSLGATVGVLASGLWLVGALGLPGTIALAGSVNLALALLVGALNHRRAPPPPPPVRVRDPATPPRLLLWVAAGTGLSSFVYELGWIRMLSMVLGAATHSFELMLSAFILGLALGGLWIRRRIDGIGNLLGWLAALQIAMGACALASLALYAQSFELMSWLLGALKRNEAGYGLFLLGSHGLAMFIMLPATFCAGTTLPLLTHALLRAGHGERSIGAVYAANTLGAIAGVLLTVHLLLPLLGLRDTVLAAAALDLALGVVLLAAGGARAHRAVPRAALACVALLAMSFAWVHLDPRRMASGVYRHGRSIVPAEHQVLFHRDGKTASIDVLGDRAGEVAILTNGKPDAAINPLTAAASPDEVTMVMAGALPLALRPQARLVANIGLGSGLTTATLLASPRLARVDTIEIEARMVEGARHFLPRVARTYDDPRSNIVVDDAKTYFSSRHARYDVIVSEPSNPWVSGVAGLFSAEFYTLVKRHLADDGVLVQWLQIYEFDTRLLASVIEALSSRFPVYAIYQTDDSDLLIVASPAGDVDTVDPGVFAMPALAAELARVGIRGVDDLRAHRVAGRALFEPLFASYRAPPNSDYHPYVDQHASLARFLERDALGVIALRDAPVPLLEMLEPGHAVPPTALSADVALASARRGRAARDVLRLLDGEDAQAPADAGLRDAVALLRATVDNCPAGLARTAAAEALFRVALATLTPLDAADNAHLWQTLAGHACVRAADAGLRRWLALYAAIGRRDAPAMRREALALLDAGADAGDAERHGLLVASAMLGALASGDAPGALATWSAKRAPGWRPQTVNVHLRLLLATALYRAASLSAPR